MRSALMALIPTLMLLTACGGHSAFENSMQVSEEAKQRMFKKPTDELTPSTPPSTTALNDYSVYRLVDAKFGADLHALSVSATIKIESSAGVESVDLVGALRPDGTASLVDLNPLPDSKNRLVAEAMCVDVGVCKQIILNVYFNVEGKTSKVQFSSASLRAEDVQPPAAAGSGSGSSSGSNSSAATPAKSTPAPAAPVTDETVDGDELHPSERALPKKTDPTDEILGDFVGAPRNEILIGKLWPRSSTPELPPVISRADDPQEATPTTGTSPATAASPAPKGSTTPNGPTSQTAAPAKSGSAVQKPHGTRVSIAPPKRATPAPTASAAKPKSSPETEGFISRWWNRVKNFLVPPIKEQKPVVQAHPKQQPAPHTKGEGTKSAPATAQAPVPAKPTHPVPPTQPTPPQQPDPTKPKPTPQPAPTPGRVEKPTQPATPAPTPETSTSTPTATSTFPYPFPPAAPVSSDGELDQRISLLEAKLAPMLNLRDGGVSQGGYSDSVGGGIRSAIINASLLPSNITGLVPVSINQNAHFGSGMLVSFLENVATFLSKQLGLKLYVGDMSLKNGGRYGGSSHHNTHRNGLDVDLAWIGSAHPLQTSALTAQGDVVKGFDYEKTWNFLRVAARQEIVQDAQKSTAVSRVFMSPAVKAGFCAWAKDNNVLDNESDQELMRLVRPVAGHHKHFHLSLKCSPHYPLCRNLAGPPPPGTGCSN